MNQFEAHLIDTRENWWKALSADDRTYMIQTAQDEPFRLPDRAVQLILSAKSPAALALHTAWEGEAGGWMLTESGRIFLESQALGD